VKRARALALAAILTGAAGCGAQDATPSRAQRPGAFPKPPAVSSATVWAVGDGANGSAPAKRVAARVARGKPLRFLYLGDVYPVGSAVDFAQNYRPVYGSLLRRTLPTPGNHEWLQRRAGYDPYWSALTHGTPPSFYAVSLAGWRIVSLNSEQSMTRGSPQGRWLARELRRPGTCRLAFWHRPRYSAGLHGDQADVAGLWNPLRGHAALVLNGHDHDMQQMRPASGLTELVAGSGGNGLYPVGRSYRRLAWSDDNTYGALRLQLRPGRASFAFVATSGKVLRRGAVSCSRG
jgi:acid phosphatase type 7